MVLGKNPARALLLAEWPTFDKNQLPQISWTGEFGPRPELFLGWPSECSQRYPLDSQVVEAIRAH